MNELDLNAINPGIRELVLRLREVGFETTDSGDGVTNIEAGMEGALDIPHVHIRSDGAHVLCADTVLIYLRMWTSVGSVQLTYDPENQIGIVSVYGVLDKDLT